MNLIKALRLKTVGLGAVLAAVLLLCGCGAQKSLRNGTSGYVIPQCRENVFDDAQCVDDGIIQVDLTRLEHGVIGVRAECERKLKFQIMLGEEKYNYDLPGDGSAVFFPLNMGSGEYTFRLMEQVEGTKYAAGWTDTVKVQLLSELEPFLAPSQMVEFNANSACVQKARELAQGCATDSDVASAVYELLSENISYDYEKAVRVQSQTGYLPNPDDTLASGKGICFDYAGLAAAMLRSVGVPCKLITGYVEDNIYHAWNSFYIKDSGWITAEIRADANSWQMVDITFAAGGMPAGEIEAKTGYTARYVY